MAKNAKGKRPDGNVRKGRKRKERNKAKEGNEEKKSFVTVVVVGFGSPSKKIMCHSLVMCSPSQDIYRISESL